MAKEMVEMPDGQVIYVGSHKYVGQAPRSVLDRIAAGEKEGKERRGIKSKGSGNPRPIDTVKPKKGQG